MAADLTMLCRDLLDEFTVLERLLETISEEEWRTLTPAAGWTVADQVTHLAYFDDRARLAAADPEAFRIGRDAALADVGGVVDRVVQAERERSGADALDWLRRARRALLDTVVTMDPSVRTPWYGPDMTVASCVTARIMETWAHGIDIHEALGVVPTATPRLAHVAFIGTRALANSFRARGLAVPDVGVRVELVAPDGGEWSSGPVGGDLVTGSMLDFCLLVVQRCHRSDTDLVATGEVADRWLDIAQAYAGPPGPGRPPRADDDGG